MPDAPAESAGRLATTILDFRVSALSAADNEQVIARAATARQGLWVVTLNLEMVARAETDPAYRALLSGADLVLADGMPLVWLSRFKASARVIPERTCGSDLVEAFLTRFPGTIGILGGLDPRAALDRLGVPDGRVVYLNAGRIALEDAPGLAREIGASGCMLLLIALGVPKQDRLAAALRPLCPGVVMMGVGGSLDFLAGHVRRAPGWMQSAGLEWLYRLLAEPGRLWRRYLLLYPRSLWPIARWALSGGRPPGP